MRRQNNNNNFYNPNQRSHSHQQQQYQFQQPPPSNENSQESLSQENSSVNNYNHGASYNLFFGNPGAYSVNFEGLQHPVPTAAPSEGAAIPLFYDRPQSNAHVVGNTSHPNMMTVPAIQSSSRYTSAGQPAGNIVAHIETLPPHNESLPFATAANALCMHHSQMQGYGHLPIDGNTGNNFASTGVQNQFSRRSLNYRQRRSNSALDNVWSASEDEDDLFSTSSQGSINSDLQFMQEHERERERYFNELIRRGQFQPHSNKENRN